MDEYNVVFRPADVMNIFLEAFKVFFSEWTILFADFDSMSLSYGDLSVCRVWQHAHALLDILPWQCRWIGKFNL